MSTLGLGLIAADSAIREQQAIKQRDQADQRFDWERQRTEADMSTLPDRTDAQRAQAQLQTAQSKSELGMVDARGKLASSQLGLAQAEVDGAQARQPDEIAAKADRAKVANLLSSFDLENTPHVIAQQKAQGTISDADIYVTSISKLADLMGSNDQAAVVRYMNGMNDAGVFGQKHAPVAKVGIVQGKDGGNVFVASDATGKPVMQMRAEDMKRIRDSVGKTDFKTVNAGDSLVRIHGGKAESVFTAPESERTKAAAAAKTGPLERDVNYLVTQHGMTQQQALAHLNQAKTMSRDQFVLKGISDAMAMGQKADPDELGAMFDRAVGRGAPGRPAPAQSAPATNWKDWLR